jgi:NAD(P)-dependent dehydrogenase (short-subunit alcohol dehydrogenase family)
MKDILITGGSKGIGLEFTRQYLHQGCRVFAASRQPDDSEALQQLQILYDDRLVIHKLDVADYGSRRDLFQALAVETEKLDVLINNAGVISGNERFSYAFGELQQDDLCRALLVNSVAPLMMAEGVFPLLEKGSKPMVVNISSDNGSISMRNSGGKYGYCTSKAALNMITKILSFDLREHGILVLSIHPGWVQTPMTRNEEAPLTPAESIEGMLQVIGSLEMEDSGRFLDWQGNEIPW